MAIDKRGLKSSAGLKASDVAIEAGGSARQETAAWDHSCKRHGLLAAVVDRSSGKTAGKAAAPSCQ
jgi:hypothetical protein